jgi:hypothetical protein
VNTDRLRQLLLVLVNRIEEVTTEYSEGECVLPTVPLRELHKPGRKKE